MIIQLKPIIPMISPKGKCYAHFLIDYGEEHHLYWVVFQDETGECWTFSNPEIRIQNNPTIGRNVPCKAALHAGLPSQSHQPQSPPPQSQPLPQPVPCSEEVRRKLAEKPLAI